jgi:hypothetical protein
MSLPSRRALQLAPALALAAAGLTATIAFSFGPTNLALHRPVTTSSIRLGNPQGAVNGIIEWGSYAVHTRSESPAWLEIDLGAVHRIHEVRIYNRGDGFYDERSARIAVQLSPEGRTFRTLGGCTAIFTQASPCRVQIDGEPARYLRLEHRTHLVLSEVEVFGDP